MDVYAQESLKFLSELKFFRIFLKKKKKSVNLTVTSVEVKNKTKRNERLKGTMKPSRALFP